MPILQHPRLREIEAFLDATRADLATLVTATPKAALIRDPGNEQWTGAQLRRVLAAS